MTKYQSSTLTHDGMGTQQHLELGLLSAKKYNCNEFQLAD